MLLRWNVLRKPLAFISCRARKCMCQTQACFAFGFMLELFFAFFIRKRQKWTTRNSSATCESLFTRRLADLSTARPRSSSFRPAERPRRLTPSPYLFPVAHSPEVGGHHRPSLTAAIVSALLFCLARTQGRRLLRSFEETLRGPILPQLRRGVEVGILVVLPVVCKRNKYHPFVRKRDIQYTLDGRRSPSSNSPRRGKTRLCGRVM